MSSIGFYQGDDMFSFRCNDFSYSEVMKTGFDRNINIRVNEGESRMLLT